MHPDEDITNLLEGGVTKVSVNIYERDKKAREACIKHFGCICKVCEFDFSKKYGAVGEGFIHVHHIIPISEKLTVYEVNPIKDLIPVCPNCHAMLHKGKFSVGELRELIG